MLATVVITVGVVVGLNALADLAAGPPTVPAGTETVQVSVPGSR
ncbi:hypothetical protein [Prescottella subtropica]|nr:hypothetical protein [Prescottella subtropica]